jgi:hypothetical protein
MQTERLLRLARDERVAGLAGFLWGFAEGLFFFIVPDVSISFFLLFSLRAGAVAWFSSIAGSAVAVFVISLIERSPGIDYLSFLQTIPGISGALVERVAGRLAVEGLPDTPFLALSGVPLKVYAGLALSQGATLHSVLLWTVFARIVRIAPTFAGAGTVGLLFRRAIDARPKSWTAFLACFWLAFYVYYFIRMGALSTAHPAGP